MFMHFPSSPTLLPPTPPFFSHSLPTPTRVCKIPSLVPFFSSSSVPANLTFLIQNKTKQALAGIYHSYHLLTPFTPDRFGNIYLPYPCLPACLPLCPCPPCPYPDGTVSPAPLPFATAPTFPLPFPLPHACLPLPPHTCPHRHLPTCLPGLGWVGSLPFGFPPSNNSSGTPGFTPPAVHTPTPFFMLPDLTTLPTSPPDFGACHLPLACHLPHHRQNSLVHSHW